MFCNYVRLNLKEKIFNLTLFGNVTYENAEIHFKIENYYQCRDALLERFCT